eukprot:SAG22_NODE_660_length_8069_cov_7.799951_4_plen_470_part_00
MRRALAPAAVLAALATCAASSPSLFSAAAGGDRDRDRDRDRGSAAAVFLRGSNATACYRIPLAVRVPCTATSGPRCAAAGVGYVLLAFAEARILNCCDFGPKRLGMSRSWDGGKSWEAQTTVWTDPTNATSAGHVASCAGPTGGKCYGCDYVGSNLGAVVHDAVAKKTLLHFSFQPCEAHIKTCGTAALVACSTDLFETWTVANITAQLRTAGLEMPWNGGPGTGVQLSSGRLVIPGFGKVAQPIYSDDGGTVYRAANPVAYGSTTSENQVASLANGSLVVNMRNGDPTQHCRVQAWSHDGGAHYTDAAAVPELTDPGCQGSTISTQSGAAHLLWHTNAASDPPKYLTRTNGQLHASSNGAQNWTHVWTVPSQGLHSPALPDSQRAFEYSALLDLGWTEATSTQRLGLVYENGWTSNAGSGMHYYCDDQPNWGPAKGPTTGPCGIVSIRIDCVVSVTGGLVSKCKQVQD